MTEVERWLPIESFEGLYEVSSLGRVRSYVRGGQPWIMAAPRVRSGYVQIVLRRGGKSERYQVSRLVCRAFHGPPPEGKPWVDHINRVRHDNRDGNVHWVSPLENSANAGLRRGSGVPGSILTEGIVDLVLNRWRDQPAALIAAALGVTAANVRKIWRRESWRHVPDAPPPWFDDGKPRDFEVVW